MPDGAILIDTPGLRELQIWEGDIDSAFADIAELAAQCKFNDCAHSTEPECVVREAIESGELDEDRWRSYVRLQRELRAIEARSSHRIQRELKSRWRARARRRDAPAATEASRRAGAHLPTCCSTGRRCTSAVRAERQPIQNRPLRVREPGSALRDEDVPDERRPTRRQLVGCDGQVRRRAAAAVRAGLGRSVPERRRPPSAARRCAR